MKKVFLLIFSVLVLCFITNDIMAQNEGQVDTPKANKYEHPNGEIKINGPVKIHPPKKQDLISSLQQRIVLINASTTLTAEQKQQMIERIQAILSELE